MSGSAGGGGDVQQAQLSKLDDIHEEIRKGNVSQAGQLPGGGGGGGGVLRGLGLGTGLGGLAAGGATLAAGATTVAAGAFGAFEGFRNMGGLENLDRLFSGEFDKGAKLPSMEEFAGTGISMLGGPIGMLFSEEITAALEDFDFPELPDLGSLQWPELPSLDSLEWPDLPELPDLSSMQWPELPDLSQEVQWPGLPSEVSNLESQVNWPQPPGWVQQLIDALESFGGGDGGGSQFAGEDSHMGGDGGTFNFNFGDIGSQIDEQAIERKIRRVLNEEVSGLGQNLRGT